MNTYRVNSTTGGPLCEFWDPTSAVKKRLNQQRRVRESCNRKKGVRGDMPNNAQKVWPNNSRSEKLVFLVAALGAYIVATPIFSGTAPTEDATETGWPTTECLTTTR